MSANNITPSKEKVSAPQPKRRNLLLSAIVASFIIFLIVGVFRMLLGGGPSRDAFLWGFCLGIVYWATTLPFTLLTIFVYRQTRLPYRFELLVAILVVGIGSIIHVIFF